MIDDTDEGSEPYWIKDPRPLRRHLMAHAGGWMQAAKMPALDAFHWLVDTGKKNIIDAYERAVDRYHMLSGAAAMGATIPDPPEPPEFDED